jgi:hypothetical protein
MDNEYLTSLRRLSDSGLVTRVKDLAARERVATSALVAHLAELDTRDIHFREGYGSLFAYCRDALSLSEHEAYNRIEVARAARRFPVILDMLAEGALNLTSARLLAPHLTPENHHAVLASACGKRKTEVEEIVARLAPRPDIATSVRRLRTTPDSSVRSKSEASSIRSSLSLGSAANGTAPLVPPTPTAPVIPLAHDRYKLQVTIGGDTLQKLRLAKDMLRHALPTGDDAAILDRALSALLIELARQKFAASHRHLPGRKTAPGSRHIPADVRRSVWVRDLGACAFVGQSGRRCSERAFVEFHHVRPFATGGEPTVSNIELRCRLCRARHKGHYAERRIMPTGVFHWALVRVADASDAA